MTAPATSRIENIHAADGREFTRFQRRLNLLAASLVVLVALVYLLQTFATVLQQLLIALFIVYLIMPPHCWLVRQGVLPLLSRIIMLVALLLAFACLGLAIGRSIVDLEEKLPRYRETLNRMIDRTTTAIPGLGDKAREWWEAVLLALAFWGALWGIVGMILAIPLVATIKAILDQIRVTRPLGRMLSNA